MEAATAGRQRVLIWSGVRKRASAAGRPDQPPHHALGRQRHLVPLIFTPPAVADLCFARAVSLGPVSSAPRLLPTSPAGSEVTSHAVAEATESFSRSESDIQAGPNPGPAQKRR